MIEKRKTYTSKIRILNIDGGGKHIILQARINGNKVNLIIDTGASNSIFDKDSEIFSNLNFSKLISDSKSSGFNSEIDNLFTGSIEKFSISYFKFSNYKAIFTSMQHINLLYNQLGLPAISGILGCNFLVETNAILDFETKILRFSPKTK